MSAPNMGELLKQAQEMQQKIGHAQEGLKKLRVEGASGGGMVAVVANGKKEILELHINKEAVDPNDLELLEDLIVAAVNQALVNADEAASAEMNKAVGMLGNLAGALKIPGM